MKRLLVVAHPDPEDIYLIAASGESLSCFDASELAESSVSAQERSEMTTISTKGSLTPLGGVDAHSEGITGLQLWLRRQQDSSPTEPWIVSASLDGTLRRWKLSGRHIHPRPILRGLMRWIRPQERHSSASTEYRGATFRSDRRRAFRRSTDDGRGKGTRRAHESLG